MRILFVGAGGVGSSAALIAARRDFFEHGSSPTTTSPAPSALVERVGDPRFVGRAGRRGVADAVAALVREHAITHVLNAVDPRFVMPIFDGAFAAGADYLDTAMSLSRRTPSSRTSCPASSSVTTSSRRRRSGRRTGRLALVGMGVEPGLADVFARYAADHLFSEIDELGVRDARQPGRSRATTSRRRSPSGPRSRSASTRR